jgi:hypothetical protein
MDDYGEQTANTGYKVVTIAFLLMFSPVGFFFLWSSKLKWPVAIKIGLTILPLSLVLLIFLFRL